MGRPPKNADHPLVRLRALLSTPNDQVTRKDLAKRTGIPEPSLKDIETGKYKMTPEVASIIAYTTGVHPQSLLLGSRPLVDQRGQPFSKDSHKALEVPAWSQEYREAMEQLFSAALDAARGKNFALLFSFLFEAWLSSTIQRFGLGALFAEKLTARLPLFDPLHIPSQFHPDIAPFAGQWKRFEEQIRNECLSASRSGNRPPEWKSVMVLLSHPAVGRIFPDHMDEINKIRTEARNRLRGREAKAAPPKPGSRKKRRSAMRPEA
jgi:DNA-binding XRE family transcriptional regulator